MKSRLLLIVSLILFSCSNNSDIETVNVVKQLVPGKNLSHKTIVLIIPFDGCSTCFHEAVDMIPDVIGNSGIVIIPDRHKKRVISFIKENGFENKGIVIDTLQKTVINRLVDINPSIFVIENNEVRFSSVVEYPQLGDIYAHVFGQE